MVTADAGRLQRIVASFAGAQLAVPLVEVPRGQLGDLGVTELREYDRFR